MNLMYSSALETIGSDDSYYPQGLSYVFSTSLNGAENDVVLAEALVSSVDELTNVLSQQLKETHDHEQQKKQATSGENKPYSSKSIIEKLKMHFEEREQLEGALRLSLGEAEHYFTFNNQTLDQLPEGKQKHYAIKDLENRLKNGKKISYTKFLNKHESTIAVPNIMGLPTIFQYEIPSLIRVEIVQDDDLDKMEVTFGKQHTGMEFSFEYESDEPLQLRRWLHEQLHSDDLVSSFLLSPNYDDDLAYTNLNITYNGRQSSARRVEIKLNYESEEYDEKERPEKQINWSQLPQEQQQRSKHLLEAAASKIHSADVDVIDAEVEFKGDEKFHYIAAAAFANSPVDKKSRVLAYLERKSSSSQAKPYKVSPTVHSQAKPYKVTFDSRGETPNTNGLDYEYAKKFDPTTINEIRLTYGRDYQNSAKVNVKAKLTQSQERKQYLDQTADAQECKKDIQRGNRQLPVCANVTAEANLLDEVSLKIEYSQVGERTREYVRDAYQLLSHLLYENIEERTREYVRDAYQLLSHLLYENIEENTVDMSGMEEHGQLEVQIDFESDFSSVNVTVDSKGIDIQSSLCMKEFWENFIKIKYIGVSSQNQVHPVFSVYERVLGELHQNQVYWPFCTIDKHAISTFDNVTYDAELSQDWSVVFHYVPDYAKHHDVSPSTT
ncbi:Vitellinogen, open beta-sheet [Popillia japonica]|uniref:Vitellinogen, open beta-sheet n=1 Tax=Popillia japonica TaxID=7064 RepID=A0AAW1L627_POPJA